MNSLLLDIAEMLREHIKTQNDDNYVIKKIKTYYDMECSLRIAVKVWVKSANADEVLILGVDNAEDMGIEDINKWFEELS